MLSTSNKNGGRLHNMHRRMDEIEEAEEEDTTEVDSTSSFSLQECIDEFRARRIRRVSTQSRETALEHCAAAAGGGTAACADDDVNFINQNRCNKEQERKCKPCKNGFCYCFSSDSGDAAIRDPQFRQTRRSRRSENVQATCVAAPQRVPVFDAKQRRRHSAPPAHVKSKLKSPKQCASINVARQNCTTPRKSLTAISSLSATANDAPLIHIIQELHNNCVISEVHVNKQKMHNLQKVERRRVQQQLPDEEINFLPSAPTLANISESDTQKDENLKIESLNSSSLESIVKSKGSAKCRHKAAGRLLEKRMSNTQLNLKTRYTLSPPPKPPRSTQSLDAKFSVSSLASTTVSVREAERVLDEFLSKKGVHLPTNQDIVKTKDKRKSFPLTQKDNNARNLATCPSLSDIERVIESKKGEVHYSKNLHKSFRKIGAEKPHKEIVLGWSDPKISEMLNYDAASTIHTESHNKSQLKSKCRTAEPQSTIGWQIPPKVSLDTVDGPMVENLAANMSAKQTPVKGRFFSNKSSGARASQKFVLCEQLRNLSPWNLKTKPFEKSNLRSSSKRFLRHSKKKILRIVSPKKENKADKPIPQHEKILRTVGVQTNSSAYRENGLALRQTPPGSYHSPAQSCGTTTSTQTNDSCARTPDTYFDFSRNIQPPAKPSARARRLEFTSIATGNGEGAVGKTYRSYQRELDEDVNLSKMGYLLRNIRSKLEASDNYALRVFQDVARNETAWQQNGLQDCDRFDQSIHGLGNHQRENKTHNRIIEPIYSEIEEDSVHISASPQYDNTNAALSDVVLPVQTTDVNDLYAKVQKPNRTQTPIKQMVSMPLAKLLQDSLKNNTFHKVALSEVNNSTRTLQAAADFPIQQQSPERGIHSPLYHSLNNLNEQHSPPKHNRHLCKSELSLQRSEIFLENLCQSELIIGRDEANDYLVKVQNTESKSSITGTQFTQPVHVTSDTADDVSYDLPDDNIPACDTVDGNLDLSILNAPPTQNQQNQSTPKKHSPRYTTKPTSLELSLPNSCQNTPQRNTSAASNEQNILSLSARLHYKALKDALRRSYRKGRKLFQQDKITSRRFSTGNAASVHNNETDLHSSCGSSINLDMLLNAENTLTTNEQLAYAVSMCRQMPELERSAEMVEAERLLLFTSMQQRPKANGALVKKQHKAASAQQQQQQQIWIDAMKLPVQAHATQDIFFNYHYFCTFECDGIISTTQSVECRSGVALFEDCGIEFFSTAQPEELQIRAKIYMLRLRKVSTLAMETPSTSPVEKLRRTSIATSESSIEALTSRFRLHASFVLQASNFVPYKTVAGDNSNVDSDNYLCLRASNAWQVPIAIQCKSSNLAGQIRLHGRVELRFPSHSYAGYLNVQDLKRLHNWNRRWCSLHGLQFAIWQDADSVALTDAALFALDLKHCLSYGDAPRDLCARPRAFVLELSQSAVVNEAFPTGFVYFAADTQTELCAWLEQFKVAMEFVSKWL